MPPNGWVNHWIKILSLELKAATWGLPLQLPLRLRGAGLRTSPPPGRSDYTGKWRVSLRLIWLLRYILNFLFHFSEEPPVDVLSVGCIPKIFTWSSQTNKRISDALLFSVQTELAGWNAQRQPILLDNLESSCNADGKKALQFLHLVISEDVTGHTWMPANLPDLRLEGKLMQAWPWCVFWTRSKSTFCTMCLNIRVKNPLNASCCNLQLRQMCRHNDLEVEGWI